MKFTRLGAFTLGIVITAASVGAVSFVNAAGNATLKACADKKTGVMRYIAKGKCKKTETALSWNQMGIQGTAGANAQVFHVVDSVGHDSGPSIGFDGYSVWIKYEGGLWNLSQFSNFPSGSLRSSHLYSDSSCTVNLAVTNGRSTSESRGWNGDEASPKFWKKNGEEFKFSNRPQIIYGKIGASSCVPSTFTYFGPYLGNESDPTLVQVTEVAPPPYTAPFTFVTK